MQKFKALLVTEQSQKNFVSSIVEKDIDELPEGEVLIRVKYSSLNFKDALSATGNPGVTRNYPHTPGIDAAGTVIESQHESFNNGDEVIVIGYDLGMNTSGGFGQVIRVPANWVIVKPEALSLKQSMIIGTAGFTAALCIEKLIHNGLKPDQGSVLVTGASGGVGTFAIALLSMLGYKVTACTGSDAQVSFLKSLGATEVINREGLLEKSRKPLLKEQWSAAVDVAGGDILFNTLKSLHYGGSVACCGLVASPMFEASVFPFILRGVNLLGVDSVNLPLDVKAKLWQLLASEWKVPEVEKLHTEITFNQLSSELDAVLKGKSVGRLVLNLES